KVYPIGDRAGPPLDSVLITRPDGHFDEFVYETPTNSDTQLLGLQTLAEVTADLTPTVPAELAVSQAVTDAVEGLFPEVLFAPEEPFISVYGQDNGDVIAIRAFFSGDGDHGSDWAFQHITYTENEIAALLEDGVLPDDEGMIDDFEEVQFEGTDTDDRIEGTEDADRIQGFDGDDRLLGLGGNDTIEGDRGDNIIFGQAGDDTLYGGAGNNYVDGGIGDDIIYAWGQSDRVQGDDGNDTIYAGGQQTTIFLEEIGLRSDGRDGELDTVHNFDLGTDKIEIAGYNLTNEVAAQDFLDHSASIDGEDVYLQLSDGRELLLVKVLEDDPDTTVEDHLDSLLDLF
ncbi:MAG: calcium-binding protein, partial [Planktomarina sp.]